jgi:serine protease
MLDAAAAVAAAQAANTELVTIAVAPASGATAGQTISLTASSTLGAGRSVASWAWTLVDGGGAVSGFASASNAASTSLLPTAAGTIVVSVQATDDLGVVHTASSTISVAAAPVVSVAPADSGGGGGGGVFSPLWLMLLALAGLALRWPPRRAPTRLPA